MKRFGTRTVVAVTLCLATVCIFLAGCSGGGGGAAAELAAATVSGVAATGAPIVGTVRIKDSSSPAVEHVAPTAVDGTFSFNVAGMKAPYMLKAEWNTADGARSLLSFATGPGTASITPLSHVAVASAAGVADAASLYETATPSMLQQVGISIRTASSALKAQLQPLYALYGATIDPVSGVFPANHTGYDKMLDVVKVNLAGGTVTITEAATGTVIYTAPVRDLAAGTAQIPPTMGTGTGGNSSSPAPDGASLYASNCAGCHGPLATTDKRGASSTRIRDGIGLSVMSSLSGLSAAEVDAIAAALGAPASPTAPAAPAPSPTPAPTPAPGTGTLPDGAALYDTYCASCHGPLATSTKRGSTMNRLQSGISTAASMRSLSSLSTAELQAIVTALGGNASSPSPAPAPTPTPSPAPAPTPAAEGASLYATYCAGCHNPLATTNKPGATVARIQSGITAAPSMRSLSTLTVPQLESIAAVLAAPSSAPTVPAPAPVLDGATLYATYCASCHRPLASSDVRRESASSIKSAITSERDMRSLSGLTSEQLQAIATVLR